MSPLSEQIGQRKPRWPVEGHLLQRAAWRRMPQACPAESELQDDRLGAQGLLGATRGLILLKDSLQLRPSVPTIASGTSITLWWNLQMKLDPELKGYGGHTMYGAEASTVKPALLHNQTVREILGYIVLNSRAEGWIVAGPPGCLGFTPYCGLWFLIETVPSTPSYGLLLRRIRENL